MIFSISRRPCRIKRHVVEKRREHLFLVGKKRGYMGIHFRTTQRNGLPSYVFLYLALHILPTESFLTGKTVSVRFAPASFYRCGRWGDARSCRARPVATVCDALLKGVANTNVASWRQPAGARVELSGSNQTFAGTAESRQGCAGVAGRGSPTTKGLLAQFPLLGELRSETLLLRLGWKGWAGQKILILCWDPGWSRYKIKV